jgi:Fe-S cluster assembly protein SufD
VRLGAAENTLIAQLQAAGANGEAERLSIAGLPTRRVERYHYTDLKMLLRAVPPMVTDEAEAVVPGLAIAGAYRLAIVNGRVQDHGTMPAGLKVGRAGGGVLTERDDVVVRLNSALAREALTLAFEGTVDL